MKNDATQKGRFILLVLGVFAFSSVHSIAQTNMAGKAPMLDMTQEHTSISTDLANALVSIATGYNIPIVAELTATEDPKVDIMAGNATARTTT
jgi:putative aminopeptidase FrvX